MSVSVLGYILNDTIIKYFAANLPIFQTIFVRGFLVSILITLVCIHRSAFKQSITRKDAPLVITRSILDLSATLFFLTALFNMPLANANAILQILPLTVTLFGAIFLGEKFGWYRAIAIMFGFLGVIFITKPGTSGFNVYSVFAIIAVLFITTREIVTRRISKESSTLLIALITAIAITLSGGIGLIFLGNWMEASPSTFLGLGAASLFIFMAYYFSIPAMQYGEISFVSPFRFTLMLWAVLLGFLVFDEIPDKLTFLGATIIILSGIFTIYRESLTKNPNKYET